MNLHVEIKWSNELGVYVATAHWMGEVHGEIQRFNVSRLGIHFVHAYLALLRTLEEEAPLVYVEIQRGRNVRVIG